MIDEQYADNAVPGGTSQHDAPADPHIPRPVRVSTGHQQREDTAAGGDEAKDVEEPMRDVSPGDIYGGRADVIGNEENVRGANEDAAG